MEIISLFLGIVIALLLSAFFSGLEMAYISFDKLLLEKKGDDDQVKHFKRMRRILKDPTRLITFVLIGNNFCLICLSSLATILIQGVFYERSERFVEIAVILILTPIIILFGELLPKNIGFNHSAQVCRFTSAFVDLLMRVAMPLIRFVLWFARILLFPIRKRLNTRSAFMTRGELRHIFEEGFEEGEMMQLGREMVRHVLDLNRMTVKQKMVPLRAVSKIQINEPVSKLKELAKRTHYARFLVYGKEPLDILGFVNIYDILFDEGENVTIKDHLRTPLFLKEEATLQKALEQLKQEKERFLCVVDEKDRVIGSLTLKRLLNFQA